jgi:hypothetical protein
VPAGHLVADLELALPGDVDLHQLDHTGRKLVTALNAFDFLEVLHLELFELAGRRVE